MTVQPALILILMIQITVIVNSIHKFQQKSFRRNHTSKGFLFMHHK